MGKYLLPRAIYDLAGYLYPAFLMCLKQAISASSHQLRSIVLKVVLGFQHEGMQGFAASPNQADLLPVWA